MMLLRCCKCGSDSGFMIQTRAGDVLDVPRKLPVDRIRNTVHVTCTYCNYKWDHVPVTLNNKDLEERVAPHLAH